MMNKYRIMFDTYDNLGGCCGTFVLNNFIQEAPYRWNASKVFKSYAEVFKDFDTRLNEFLQELFTNYGYDSDETKKLNGSQVGYVTLITKYPDQRGDEDEDDAFPFGKEGQFPELLTYFLLTGWRVDRQWINSNTKNALIQLSKEFTADDVDWPDEENKPAREELTYHVY